MTDRRGAPELVISASGTSDFPADYFRVSTSRNAAYVVKILARRHWSLAELEFTAIGYKYTAGTRGIRPRIFRDESHNGPYHLIVQLPPQHFAETLYPKGQNNNPTAPPAKARLSAPSRLVFRIPADLDRWDSRNLDIDELCDWSGLKLLVHPRAAGTINEHLASQLRAAFDDADLEKLCIEDARQAIEAKLTAPGDLETMLEVAGRLQLSPSEHAGWIRSESGPPKWQETETPTDMLMTSLWSLRLDRAGAASVRAIWSSRFREGAFPKALQFEDEPSAEASLSIGPRAHRDVIGQSSVYGLPALRRLAVEDAESDDFADNKKLAAAPRGRVVRPDSTVKFLNEMDAGWGNRNEDTGIALATPFTRAAIELTALGASVDAEWKGEPPRLRAFPRDTPKEDRWDGFDLERLAIRTWLGRDSRVVSVFKGFLFPIGVRASMVRVCERQIVQHSDRGPVSFLVYYEVIVCPSHPRAFPGPYHPNEGREFPAASIRMKTRVTPPLIVKKIDIGKDDKDIFWPQVKAPDGKAIDFQFEWESDEGVTIKSPLAFVINSAASRSDWMLGLAKYYNGLGDSDPRRIATLGGARKRYAEPLEAGSRRSSAIEADTFDWDGSTSFDTDRWVLGVAGRADAPEGRAQFEMDGRMEGADQPPFYPFVERARIGIQSVDQLLGTPNGRYDVRFHTPYIKGGFDKSHDIFLRLLGTDADMGAAKDPGKTGGIAGQKLTIGAISRRIGPVGGEKSGSALVPRGTTTEIDIGAAGNGKFDPGTFFGEMKLLGLLDLKKLLKGIDADIAQAPALLETYKFGAGALSVVNEAARRVRAAIYGGSPRELKGEIEDWLDGYIGNTGMTVATLYPDLATALRALLNDLREPLDRLAIVPDLASVPPLASKILKLAKPAERELSRIIADPVPQALREAFETLRTILAQIADAPRQAIKFFFEWLTTEEQGVANWLGDMLCHVIENEQLALPLLGRTLTCADIKCPAAALADVAQSYFADCFGIRFAEAVGRLIAWHESAKMLAALLPRTVDATVAALLAEAADAIGRKLQPFDLAITHDPRNPVVQARFARVVVAELAGLLDVADGDIRKTIRHIDALSASFVAWRDTDLERLVVETLDLPVVDPNELAVVQTELLTLVQQRIDADILEPLDLLARSLMTQLRELADAIDEGAVDLLTRVLDDVHAMLGQAIAFARLPQHAAAWCAELNQAGDTIALGLIREIDQLYARAIEPLIDCLEQLTIEPETLPRIAAAKARMLAAAHRIEVAVRIVVNAPRPQFDFCTDPGAGVAQIVRIADLRKTAAIELAIIAREMKAIYDDLGTIGQGRLNNAAEEIKELFRDLVGLGQVGVGQAWTDLQGLIEIIGTKVDAYEHGFKDHVLLAFQQAGDGACAIVEAMDGATTADELADRIASIDDYIVKLDRTLSARLFAIAAMSQAAAVNLINSANTAADEFGKDVVEPILTPVLDTLVETVSAILDLASTDQMVGKILQYALGKDPVAELISIKTALEADRATTVAITSVTTLKTCIDRLALPDSGVKQLGRLVSSLEMKKFGQHLTNQIREQLTKLLDQVRDIVRSFVPTAMTTQYFWKTKIPSFPAGDPIFSMAGEGSDDDLSIATRISVDLAQRTMVSEVRGTLKSFKLKVFGTKLPMATLTFAETSFVSKNGATPQLSLRVQSVEIDQALKFIQALQQWLAPGGSGFYLKPQLDDGVWIEAGYLFAAGLIQVGSLQFINVSFAVGARLSLSGKPAQMFLKLSSAERPFLVANPPYGGGGYVALTFDPSGLQSVSLSFVFGGVAALRFGPLSAQARVVAGVGVRSYRTDIAGTEKGALRTMIIAIFEAVGEGSIACFSISVMIRITLTQRSDGALWGESLYSFSFKVGFFKVRYKVTARYNISNKKHGSGRILAIADQAAAAGPVHNCKAPAKATDWAKYKKHLALDLLGGTQCPN